MAKWRRVWSKIPGTKPVRYKRAWQRVKQPAKYGYNGTIGPAVRFTWAESDSGDGEQAKGIVKHNVVNQARLLNELRKNIAKHYRVGFGDVSINVNSWYRSPSYNNKIGGATMSQHMTGKATDITVYVSGKMLTPKKVAELAESVPGFRNGGIGWYDSAHGNFTHVDHRSDGPARWINKG